MHAVVGVVFLGKHLGYFTAAVCSKVEAKNGIIGL
jgi:hypothetical protein